MRPLSVLCFFLHSVRVRSSSCFLKLLGVITINLCCLSYIFVAEQLFFSVSFLSNDLYELWLFVVVGRSKRWSRL